MAVEEVWSWVSKDTYTGLDIHSDKNAPLVRAVVAKLGVYGDFFRGGDVQFGFQPSHHCEARAENVWETLTGTSSDEGIMKYEFWLWDFCRLTVSNRTNCTNRDAI